ncbi:MAG: PAS domain-containing methyl-accepting chemotaxis protein [Emcibacteraceae bacterium]|nr:PAS domain-containing methyl-accepting chemotaxis protein [Emcibacteraceae bacterium]
MLANIMGKQNIGGSNNSEMKFILEALDKSQATIQFKTDGTIITANKNFLDVLDYSLDEVQGKHHSMFVDPSFKNSDEYKQFWAALSRGEFQAKEYKRIGKGGKEVWIQASYNPIKDKNGSVVKVVKYATDITERTMLSADHGGQIDAISKSQAVISFELDGTIIDANDNFLNTVGYSLGEVQGKHHSMFVEESYVKSSEYKQFWDALARGEFKAAEFKRIGKGGKEVWIQASYNPIFDPNGKPFKVVKYATDITAQKLKNSDFRGQIDAINKAQAVISFELDGTIIQANENFLNTLGYSTAEVESKHHSMFVEPGYAQSAEYKQFWEALARGEYQANEYKRLGKGGKEVWIQASYNPIFDPSGNPFKVVKFATDITAQVLARQEASRVGALVDESLGQIQKTVANASEQSVSAADASSQTIQTVQTVAAAAEEFEASAQEIARSMERSREDVTKVRSEAENANESAQKLSETATSLGSIVDVISDIASQINLLALNATIESARAGEAGKGFAVVASEVKSLANQVGDATQRISTEIGGMQSVSSDVVTRLDGIKDAVQSVEESVTSVSVAVEQQAGASQEITRSMQVAATAVEEINTNLNSISEAVTDANNFANEGIELYRSLKSSAG